MSDEERIFSTGVKEALQCLLVSPVIARQVLRRPHRQDRPSSDRVKPSEKGEAMELTIHFK